MISRVIPPILQKQGKMNKGVTSVIFFIVITLTSFSQTIIEEGDIFGNWNISESPFFINGNITIPTDKKLSIEPGVEIIFQGNYTFTIIGRITAQGSLNDSIILTSADTAGFSTGTYNGWKGLSFIGYTSTQTEKSILKYCKIEYSSSNGIFCMDYSNLEIDNSSIKNNLGFGISINEFSDININDVNITGNYAGGIGINSSNPTISGFEISNNFGSGVSVNGSGTSTFINGIITDNFTSSNGGGVNVGIDANVIIENVKINGNIAANGGGVSCMMGYITLTNCLLKENNAFNGGGISAEYMASVSLDHVLIIRNNANENGGGINIIESDLNIVNSTISDNTAITDAGGMLLNNSSLHSANVLNSIFWNNLPLEISTGNELPEITYSDIEGGFEGEGNIDANPLFSNPDEEDYTLQWNDYPAGDFTKSPCIDGGNPSLASDPDGTTNDMGAFYFDQTYITAVDNYLNDNEIVVYPNPATDIINIKGLESYKRVIITSLPGNIVKDITTSNNVIALNISDLKTGIYLMVLYNQNGTIFKKKIVKK
jgi:hypothetical protein